METMNIFALKGHKVMVTNHTKENGLSSDSEKIRKYLTVNKIYEVERTNVYDFKTEVFLVGFEGISFNSVNFVDISKQKRSENIKHPQWYCYH